MKEHPILFKTEMVKAIIEGRKSITRRIVKSTAKSIYWQPIVLNGYGGFVDEHGNPVKCRYSIGDFLWVKETFQSLPDFSIKYRYKADHLNPKDVIWKPSIFMPKSAARIWLEITDIKVEKLQDISEEDAILEGIERMGTNPMTGTTKWKAYPNFNPITHWWTHPVDSFKSLWQSINGEESWNSNPFVWAVTFKTIKP